jgi:hypothetical protein
MKVDKRNKVIEKHIQEGVFGPPGPKLEDWAEAECQDGVGGVLLCHHGAVVASGIVKLGAAFWLATITNSCHGGAGG